MTVNVGKNKNTFEASDVTNTVVAANSSTSTTLSVANELRLDLTVDNGDNNQDIWVKLQTAATDNSKEWYLVERGTRWVMSQVLSEFIYLGEISGIFQSGGSNDVQVIEVVDT